MLGNVERQTDRQRERERLFTSLQRQTTLTSVQSELPTIIMSATEEATDIVEATGIVIALRHLIVSSGNVGISK